MNLYYYKVEGAPALLRWVPKGALARKQDCCRLDCSGLHTSVHELRPVTPTNPLTACDTVNQVEKTVCW